MRQIRYRTEAFGGSGERDAAKVMAFETFELGNTDILECLAESILKNNPIREKLIAFGDELIDNGFVDDMPEENQINFFKEVLGEIEKETSVSVKYALWLADKEAVTNRKWYGRDMVDDLDFDSYEIGPVVLSDLEYDGTLYGYTEEPVRLEDRIKDLRDELVDIINEREGYVNEGIEMDYRRATWLDNRYSEVDNLICKIEKVLENKTQKDEAKEMDKVTSITLAKMQEDLETYELDTEYREAFAQAEMELGYLNETPLNMAYGSAEQQFELKKVENTYLTKSQIKEFVGHMDNLMKSDYQYGNFKPFVNRYLSDSYLDDFVFDEGLEVGKDKEEGLLYTDRCGCTYTVYPKINTYVDGNHIYLGLDFDESESGCRMPFCDVTVNTGAVPYLENTVDTNNLGNGIIKWLEDNGFGKFAGTGIPSGRCFYPVFRFNEDKLREIDPDVFADYARAYGREVKPTLDSQIAENKVTECEDISIDRDNKSDIER